MHTTTCNICIRRFIALVGLHGHGKSSILKMFGGELLPGEGVQNALRGQAGIGHLALIDSQSLAFGVPCGTSHCAVLEGRPGISRHWIQVKCLGPRVFNVLFLAGNLPGFFVPPHLRALKLNRQSYKPLYIIIPLYMSYSKPQLVCWELDQLDQLDKLDRGAACGN